MHFKSFHSHNEKGGQQKRHPKNNDDYLVPGILAKYGLVNDTVKCKYIVELTRTQALTDTVMAFVFDPTKQKL